MRRFLWAVPFWLLALFFFWWSGHTTLEIYNRIPEQPDFYLFPLMMALLGAYSTWRGVEWIKANR